LTLALGVATAACTAGDGGGTTAPSDAGPAGLELELVAAEPGPVALGEAFAFSVIARNAGPRSVTVAAEVRLTSPGDDAVPFTTVSLFVPHEGEASQEVTVTPAQWFADVGDFDLAASVTEPASAADSLSFVVDEADIVMPQFEDITDAAGLATTVPAAECGQFANGAAWGDVDADGDLDLAVTRLGDPVQLFVNDGTGRFAEEGADRGVAVAGANGAAFADYDNDGDADLVLVGDGSDVLLRNDGGRFVDVSAAAGLGDDGRRGVSASWGDFDADGHLDLYVTNYMQCTGEWETEEDIIANVAYDADTLYRNNGDGTFSDVTEYLGEDTNGAGFAATWFDYNGDNRLDLYLANDFVGVSPDHNHLWRNDGPGPDGWRFTDVSDETGTAFWMNTMGIAVGDVDQDGDLDMALSNITANKLVSNDGEVFVDDVAAGIGRPMQQADTESITWGGGFHDFNLDGWEDLYLAAGGFEGVRQAGVQPNELFVNAGDGTFRDVSAATGADDVGDSKGVAFADYDADGRMDLFVVNQGGSPRLLRNVTPPGDHHWLQVDTTGTVSNRDGCGARVVVTTEEATHVHQVWCGSTSVASGSQSTVHVGLGPATDADVEVWWPSGTRQRMTDVAADQTITVEEVA
jgi:hypothetical protein